MYPRFMIYATAMLALLVLTSQAQAAPFDISCGGASDVDTDPATIVLCTSGTAGTITDLNVVLNIDDLSATDAYATDLQISLIHVATSTSAVIYLGPELFAPTSMMDATFDDSAAGAPPGSGNIVGIFLPQETLAIFNGLELSGDWNLTILDQAFPGEGIDVIEWRLTGTQVPEPSSALLLALGLFGLTRLSGHKHARL